MTVVSIELRDEVINTEYCAICDNQGYILMKRQETGTKTPYEYVLHCPFCNAGRSWEYDGSKCKGKPSRYFIQPLTKHFGDKDIQALREANLEKQKRGRIAEMCKGRIVEFRGKELNHRMG